MSLFVYIYIYFGLFISSFISSRVLSSFLHWSIFFLLTTTYYNGSDWRVYELAYLNIDDDIFELYRLQWGPFFVWFISFFNALGISFHWFVIVFKVFTLAVLLRFIRVFSSSFKYALSIALLSMGLFLFIDNPFRQMLAVAMFLISILFFGDGRTFYALLFFVVGLFFHASMILAAPFILFYRRCFSNFFYVSVFFISILIIFNIEVLGWVFYKLGEVIPIFGFYYRNYLSGQLEFDHTSFSFYFFLILFFLLYLGRFVRKPILIESSLFELSAFMFPIVGMFSAVSVDFLRFSCFLFVPFSVYLTGLLKDIDKGRIIQLGVLVAFLVLSMNLVLNTYKYLPYTNYPISLIFDDLKSYEYRRDFHKNFRRD